MPFTGRAYRVHRTVIWFASPYNKLHLGTRLAIILLWALAPARILYEIRDGHRRYRKETYDCIIYYITRSWLEILIGGDGFAPDPRVVFVFVSVCIPPTLNSSRRRRRHRDGVYSIFNHLTSYKWWREKEI